MVCHMVRRLRGSRPVKSWRWCAASRAAGSIPAPAREAPLPRSPRRRGRLLLKPLGVTQSPPGPSLRTPYPVSRSGTDADVPGRPSARLLSCRMASRTDRAGYGMLSGPGRRPPGRRGPLRPAGGPGKWGFRGRGHGGYRNRADCARPRLGRITSRFGKPSLPRSHSSGCVIQLAGSVQERAVGFSHVGIKAAIDEEEQLALAVRRPASSTCSALLPAASISAVT